MKAIREIRDEDGIIISWEIMVTKEDLQLIEVGLEYDYRDEEDEDKVNALLKQIKAIPKWY